MEFSPDSSPNPSSVSRRWADFSADHAAAGFSFEERSFSPARLRALKELLSREENTDQLSVCLDAARTASLAERAELVSPLLHLLGGELDASIRRLAGDLVVETLPFQAAGIPATYAAVRMQPDARTKDALTEKLLAALSGSPYWQSLVQPMQHWEARYYRDGTYHPDARRMDATLLLEETPATTPRLAQALFVLNVDPSEDVRTAVAYQLGRQMRHFSSEQRHMIHLATVPLLSRGSRESARVLQAVFSFVQQGFEGSEQLVPYLLRLEEDQVIKAEVRAAAAIARLYLPHGEEGSVARIFELLGQTATRPSEVYERWKERLTETFYAYHLGLDRLTQGDDDEGRAFRAFDMAESAVERILSEEGSSDGSGDIDRVLQVHTACGLVGRLTVGAYRLPKPVRHLVLDELVKSLADPEQPPLLRRAFAHHIPFVRPHTKELAQSLFELLEGGLAPDLKEKIAWAIGELSLESTLQWSSIQELERRMVREPLLPLQRKLVEAHLKLSCPEQLYAGQLDMFRDERGVLSPAARDLIRLGEPL